MPTHSTVAGETALVTGASSGIGEQITEQFAAGGVDVAICSRDQDHVDPVAESITARNPGRVLPIECDVRDKAGTEAMIERTVAEFGGLDVLVNNAGAAFHCPFDDLSENAWTTIVDINLNGIYNCTHSASEALKDGGGSVINVSSVAGIGPTPGETHYAAAKAGVNNLTQSLAAEWAVDGVRVNCVAPGYVATADAVTAGDVDPDSIDRTEVDRQIGRTEEIADVVEFLASEAASFVIGEVIVAKGAPRTAPAPTE